MGSLEADIKEFLDQHAGIRGDYDPEWDEPDERFSSPDASELLHVAHSLAAGWAITHMPNASWESGGFKPYSDQEARAKFDALMERIKAEM